MSGLLSPGTILAYDSNVVERAAIKRSREEEMRNWR